MDNLAVAMALIQEAKEEKERLIKFQKDRDAFYAKPAPKDWGELYRKWPKEPHQSVVRDNLKVARRLLKKEYD